MSNDQSRNPSGPTPDTANVAAMLSVPYGVPTIYVDGVQGLTIINDVIKINFFQVVQDLPLDLTDPGEASHHREVVLRLALSPVTLIQFLEWIKVAFPYTVAASPEGQVGSTE